MSIRFYDAEVDCVYSGQYTRDDLRGVFFGKNGRHRLVCVLNEDGTFNGKISYQTYLSGNDKDMIDRTKVVLNQDIFKHAKQFFRKNWSEHCKTVLLPLVDEDGFLISTCYYDPNMNEVVRKCRELRELEHVDGLFAEDVQQIIIYGCNEAAVGVYNLFKKNGYSVVVKGEQWRYLGIEGDQRLQEIPDYRIYHLYAEGNRAEGSYRADVYELLTYHISCQFQFLIDRYGKESSLPLLEPWDKIEKKLKETRQPVVLMGFEDYDYNFLKKRGIEIAAVRLLWLDDYWQVDKYLWYGIKVLTEENLKKQYQNAIYVIPHLDDRAYEENFLDTLESEGCYRNHQVVCLSDYFEKPEKNIEGLVCGQKIILTGEKYLCDMAGRYMCKEWNIKSKNVFFLDLQQKEEIVSDFKDISKDECIQYKDAIYFVVVERFEWNVREKEMWRGSYYAKTLLQMGITNINPYFLNHLDYFQTDNRFEWKKEESDFPIKIAGGKKVIYALIPGHSGSILVNELLDGHPELLFIGGYSDFRYKLLEYACHLSKIQSFEDKEKMLRSFLENTVEFDIEEFLISFRKVLEPYSEPVAKEILIAFYIAYSQLTRKDRVKEEFAIYFEPHCFDLIRHKSNIQWFQENGFDVKILDVQRNSVQKAGSVIKALMSESRAGLVDYRRLFGFSGNCIHQDTFLVRFEDLKTNPEQVLYDFCNYAGITFETILLKTTFEGEEGRGYMDVKGFDLKPVYNLYEDYFSEFDRFRIRLIDCERQKALGYEYADPEDFSAEELENMLSFPFKFERSMEFMSEDARKEYFYRRKRGIKYYMKLQKERVDYYNRVKEILKR